MRIITIVVIVLLAAAGALVTYGGLNPQIQANAKTIEQLEPKVDANIMGVAVLETKLDGMDRRQQRIEATADEIKTIILGRPD